MSLLITLFRYTLIIFFSFLHFSYPVAEFYSYMPNLLLELVKVLEISKKKYSFLCSRMSRFFPQNRDSSSVKSFTCHFWKNKKQTEFITLNDNVQKSNLFLDNEKWHCQQFVWRMVLPDWRLGGINIISFS